MEFCHVGGIIGVMKRTSAITPRTTTHRSPRPFKTPQVARSVGRFIRGGFQPTLGAS
jgi:hypothetical protein